MSRIVIGIHGLGNKPSEHILKMWWQNAINEGLIHIGHPGIFFQFQLVYWADILHPEPLDLKETNPDRPGYIEYPYTPAVDFVGKPPGKFRRKILDFLEKELDKIFVQKRMKSSFNSVSNMLIRHYFKDLDLYYSSTLKDENDIEIPVKELVRQRLISVLRKHQGKKILLIAHSMGSIIAYEVLMLVADQLNIDTLVTIGSPLGQPLVINRFYEEIEKLTRRRDKPRTPENILRNWFNLTDLEDHVAINYNLSDDYEENSQNVRPIDHVVYNSYIYSEKRNPHKSYGYLRTPELADILYQFLSRDRSRLGFWLANRYVQLRQKLISS